MILPRPALCFSWRQRELRKDLGAHGIDVGVQRKSRDGEIPLLRPIVWRMTSLSVARVLSPAVEIEVTYGCMMTASQLLFGSAVSSVEGAAVSALVRSLHI